MVRFRGPIERAARNPFVAVPERVSRALAPFALHGRIRIEGTVRGTSFRASLVPVRTGGHRLYVSGGMRAASGAEVGETVSFVVSPVAEGEVSVPADLAAELDRSLARGPFDALTASHRRELIRYLDDARTPATRARRIEQTVDQALGRFTPTPRRETRAELWTCPRCGHRFVTRNMSHSCTRYALEDVLGGKPQQVRALFDRFRSMVESCGQVEMVVYRDRVGFMDQVRFAGAAPRSRWLDVEFWLARRVEDPRFRRIETIYPDAHINSLRITSPDQLDEQVMGWIRESYAIGASRPSKR